MELYRLPEGIQTRWASPENARGEKGRGGRAGCGRKGMANLYLRPGQRVDLARAQGSGVIRRIWLTLHDLGPLMLKQLKLEMYWDGAETPAVCVPLGDFFCMNTGRMARFESALFSSPEGRSFNCFIPMPFRTGMRIALTNEGKSMAQMLYYDIDYTLGDAWEPGTLYFHAWYNQELPTKQLEDYMVLSKLRGRGRYLGASFGVRMDQEAYGKSWGGEGEVKIYLDGDGAYPTLCGTGTEDYIGTGWCQGEYSHRYQGCTVADEAQMVLGFYRFHIPDPVYFHEDIRVTIQQIGSWNPGLLSQFARDGLRPLRAGILAADPPRAIDPADPSLPPFDLFERSDFWSSCCYFYLDAPEHALPALPALPERARAIPGFRKEALEDMGREPEAVKLIKKYVPNLDELPLGELKRLLEALGAVVYVLERQEEAYGPQDGGAQS